MITVYYYKRISFKVSGLRLIAFNVSGLDDYFKTHLPDCYEMNNSKDKRLNVQLTNKLLHILNVVLNIKDTKHYLYYQIPETNKKVQLQITVRADGIILYGISVFDSPELGYSKPYQKYTVNFIK